MNAKLDNAFQVLRRVAGVLRGIRSQHHAHPAHLIFVQQAHDRQSVASVVAFAAQDHDVLAVDRIELAHHFFHHAMGRVLHQRDARDAIFDGQAVHFAHLLRCQNFHAETDPMRRAPSFCRLLASPIAIR